MRWIRYLFITIGVVAILATAALVYVFNMDLSPYKDEVEDFISKKTGRDFQIDGTFEPSLGKTIDLVVEDVRFANADWGVAAHALIVDRLVVSVSLRSLWDGPVIIHNLEVYGLELHVEKNRDTGQSMWDFPAGEEKPEPAMDFIDDDDPIPVVFENVIVEDFAVVYGEGWLEAPRRLAIASASIDGEPGQLLNVAIDGNIDETTPVVASGTVGPLEALISGRDISWDLVLGVGQFQATTRGRVRDLFKLEGPDIEIDIEGPSAELFLSRLALPAVSEGPIDMNATIVEDQDGIHARLTGAFGDLKTEVGFQADSLQELQAGRLEADIAGPNVQIVSAIVDVGDLAAKPFSVNVLASAKDGVINISRLNGTIGQDEFSISGTIEDFQEFRNLSLEMALAGPDAADAVRPWLSDGLPAEPFSVNVLASMQDGLIDVKKFDATIGRDELSTRGTIQFPQQFQSLSLDLSFAGPDAESSFKPWVKTGLPGEPYKVTGKIDFDRQSLHFQDLDVAIGRFTANLNGTTGRLPSLDGLDMSIVADTPDAKRSRQMIRELAPKFSLPAKAMHVTTTVTRNGDQWGISETSIVSGNHMLEADGSLGNLEDIAGIDLRLKVKGPDLREFLSETTLTEAVPYNIGGVVSISEDLISFTDVAAAVGRATASIDGRLPISMQLSDANVSLKFQIPDLDKLGDLMEIEWLQGGPFEFEGNLSKEGARYVAKDMAVRLADSNIRGDFGIEIDPKLKVVGTLESDSLNLAPFLPPIESPGEEEPEPATSDGRAIPDQALPFELLSAVDLDVDLSIGDLQTRRHRIGDIELHVLMNESRLELRTGNLSLTNGGNVSIELGANYVDGIGKIGVRVIGQNFNLRKKEDAEGNPISRPLLDVAIELGGTGTSVRDVAATSNGYVHLELSEGQVENSFSGFLMRDVFAQVFSTLNPLAKKSSHTTLECAILSVIVVNGVATANVFAGRTPQISMASIGTVDLSTEAIDFTFRTRQREGIGVSLAGAINPYIKVAGTLASPALQVDAKRGFWSGTFAVLTGGISILAQGMFDRYLAADDLCEAVAAGIDAGEIGEGHGTDVYSLDELLPFMKKSN